MAGEGLADESLVVNCGGGSELYMIQFVETIQPFYNLEHKSVNHETSSLLVDLIL